VANYVENPSTWNLINIFVKSNTLGFAINHYSQSLINPLFKKNEKQKNIIIEAKELLSAKDRIIQNRSQSSKNLSMAEKIKQGSTKIESRGTSNENQRT
jgi:hypothetical protein